MTSTSSTFLPLISSAVTRLVIGDIVVLNPPTKASVKDGSAVPQPGLHVGEHRRQIVSLDFSYHQVVLLLCSDVLSVGKLEELSCDSSLPFAALLKTMKWYFCFSPANPLVIATIKHKEATSLPIRRF
jgi:hypothetical protein